MNSKIKKDGKKAKEWQDDRKMSKHVPRLRKKRRTEIPKYSDVTCLRDRMCYICCQDSNSALIHFTVNTPGAI